MALSFFGLFLALTSASAITFQWSAITWPDDSFSNAYDIDPANPGDDIRITLSDPGTFISPSPNVYPVGNTFAFTGGISPTASVASQNLDIYVNHGTNLQFTTITIDFLYAGGVNTVDWALFDIDASAVSGQFLDQIRNISATDGTSTFYGPTVTITNPTFVTTTGSGSTLTVEGIDGNTAGDQTSDGTAVLDFGTTTITSLTFDYGNAAGVQANPTQQGIGLHDINFNPVPEPSATFLILLAAGALVLRRRRS